MSDATGWSCWFFLLRQSLAGLRPGKDISTNRFAVVGLVRPRFVKISNTCIIPISLFRSVVLLEISHFFEANPLFYRVTSFIESERRCFLHLTCRRSRHTRDWEPQWFILFL
jgi:hypothetical protein